MKKKVLSLLLAFALVFSVFSAALAVENEPTFSDVPANHWAFTFIEELVERKAINGYPDGKFYPDKTVSREEFAKIMVVAAGLAAVPAAESTYADVPLTYWASPYIETARPYMTAYQNQGQLYFYPAAGALREDIAVAVVKLKGLNPSMADQSILSTMFSDVGSISEVARPYVALAVEQGIINGYTDGTFRGQGTITRSEAAAILWRAFQRGSGDKVIPDDILPSVTPSQSPTPAPTPTPTPSAAPTPTPTPTPSSVPSPTPTPTPEPQADIMYGIISAYNGAVKVNGDAYRTYTVDVNDKRYTVYTNVSGLAKGKIVELKLTSDDIYTGSELKLVTAAAGYVSKYSGRDNTITVVSSVYKVANDTYVVDVSAVTKVYTLDSGTRIYYVDQDNDKGAVGGISEFSSFTGKKNVIIIDDDNDNVADVIIFEVSNEADIL